MPFSFFQRKTISPAKTKDKKGKTDQRLSFADNRANSNDIEELQNNIDNSENTQSISQLQKKVDNSKPLPEDLKEGVEQLSGQDMSDVKVNYNSNKPQQLDAHAYANGNEIEIAPGQEKHLPHEAWHVVQQKQNKVKPTDKTKSGELINDEQLLEDESDRMGNKALEYKSPINENIKKSKNVSPIFQLAKDEKKKKKSEEEKKDDEEKENVEKEEAKREEEKKETKKEDVEGKEEKDKKTEKEEEKKDGEEKKEAKKEDVEGKEEKDKKEAKTEKKDESKKEDKKGAKSSNKEEEKEGKKKEKSNKSKKKAKSKSNKKSKRKKTKKK